MRKSLVASIPINNNYKQAFERLIQTFPDLTNKIKEKKKIFIKINIDQQHDFLHSDLGLIELLLEHIQRTNPAAKIFFMENNIHGNLTRLLVNVIGFSEIIRKYKAKFLYLDERKPTMVSIGKPENQYKIQFPDILFKQLISERNDSFYLNLALLRTHYYTKVAGGLFNQLGFVARQSQRFIYTPHIHQLIVDLLQFIQPDFSIVDANVVIEHGMLPPESLIEKYSVPVNRLLGGTDPVAVDRIGLALLGYSPLDIKYMKLAIENRLGEGELDYIDIVGSLPPQLKKIPYSREISQLPQRMDIVIGKNFNHNDHCLGLALQFIQIMHKDFSADRSFTLLTGNEFTKKQLDNMREPVIVLGKKTCDEVATFLKERYRSVYYINHCANILHIIAILLKVLKVNKYYLIGANPFTTWKQLFISKLKGSRFSLPVVTPSMRRWNVPKKNVQNIRDKK